MKINYDLKVAVLSTLVGILVIFGTVTGGRLLRVQNKYKELLLNPITEVITEVEEVTEVVIKPQLTREEVTEYVRTKRDSGGYGAIVDFYNGIVADTDLTYLILAAADLYDIPVNTLFALCWAESGFNPKAVNGANNKDGTNDKGLMQLNSRYFGKVDRLDPKINLQYGCRHLRDRYETYGSWDESVMYYNGFSKASADHQSRVLAKERELDRLLHLEGI